MKNKLKEKVSDLLFQFESVYRELCTLTIEEIQYTIKFSYVDLDSNFKVDADWANFEIEWKEGCPTKPLEDFLTDLSARNIDEVVKNIVKERLRDGTHPKVEELCQKLERIHDRLDYLVDEDYDIVVDEDYEILRTTLTEECGALINSESTKKLKDILHERGIFRYRNQVDICLDNGQVLTSITKSKNRYVVGWSGGDPVYASKETVKALGDALQNFVKDNE